MKKQKGPGFLSLLLVLFVAGCSPSGPPRYEVSGRVIYDGKPVPAGRVVFETDESKGNVGPVATAEIKDGTYRTKPSEGHIGGPHVVFIFGCDGVPDPVEPDEAPQGRSLFPTFRTNVNLPKGPSTQDFDVPVGETKNRSIR